jgi:hypothetical protein
VNADLGELALRDNQVRVMTFIWMEWEGTSACPTSVVHESTCRRRA